MASLGLNLKRDKKTLETRTYSVLLSIPDIPRRALNPFGPTKSLLELSQEVFRTRHFSPRTWKTEGFYSAEPSVDVSTSKFPAMQPPDFFTHRAGFTNPQAHG